MKFIPYGRQQITQEDIDSVVKVLKSDFLTQGPVREKFESLIKKYCNVNYAVASNSATSALHIACLALNVGKGDIVWTSPISFVASSNCALYCGANVDFVDIDPNTFNISIELLKEKLEVAKKNNKLPKVIIPVHFAGQSCEMKEIFKLSKEYNFKVIEDASHAIGGSYKGDKVGSCKYSDVTIFSFHPVKIITTAEGGVATTNSLDLDQKMRMLCSHGITRDEKLFENDSDGDWYYQQLSLGFNYRMTEMQAALGCSQMNRLDSYVETRNVIAKKYDSIFDNMKIKHQVLVSDIYSSYHLYVIKVAERKKIFNYMKSKKIGVNVHYIPIHLQPYYKKLGFKLGDFPNAEKYYNEALSIPLNPGLSDENIDYIIKNLSEVL